MNRFFQSRRTRFVALASLACLSMAFTLPGCPDVDGMNAKMADLEKKATDSAKSTKELTEQLRILNDEHNTMKQLVSQISTTVLEQKEVIERVEAAAARRAAPPPAAAKKAPMKRRR